MRLSYRASPITIIGPLRKPRSTFLKNKNGAADWPCRWFLPRAPERIGTQAAGVAMLLLGGSFRRLFGRLLDAVLAIEPLDASRGIDQPLFASIKRMALRADLDLKRFERRTSFEGVAARTDDCSGGIQDGFRFSFYFLELFHLLCCRIPSHGISHNSPVAAAVSGFSYRYRHLAGSNNKHDFRDYQSRRARLRNPHQRRPMRQIPASRLIAGPCSRRLYCSRRRVPRVRRVRSRFSIASSRSSAKSRSIPGLVLRFSKSSTNFRLDNRR